MSRKQRAASAKSKLLNRTAMFIVAGVIIVLLLLIGGQCGGGGGLLPGSPGGSGNGDDDDSGGTPISVNQNNDTNQNTDPGNTGNGNGSGGSDQDFVALRFAADPANPEVHRRNYLLLMEPGSQPKVIQNDDWGRFLDALTTELNRVYGKNDSLPLLIEDFFPPQSNASSLTADYKNRIATQISSRTPWQPAPEGRELGGYFVWINTGQLNDRFRGSD